MRFVSELYQWIRTIVLAIAFAIVINVFVIQPTKVMGSSMQPTLQDKEIILISKLPHTLRDMPDYNDIVIIDSRVDRARTLKDDLLENPLFTLLMGKNEHDIWVKRVIGKPGDVLEFKNNKVYRNGEPLNEPYIKEPMITPTSEKVVVPKDHIFVMGDNRNNSKDSRVIGCIPLDHVLGKKVF